MRNALRLSDLEPGDNAIVLHGPNPRANRRLAILGLIDGTRLRIELRCRDGHLIVCSEDERFRISARHAEQIWVCPPARR